MFNIGMLLLSKKKKRYPEKRFRLSTKGEVTVRMLCIKWLDPYPQGVVLLYAQILLINQQRESTGSFSCRGSKQCLKWCGLNWLGHKNGFHTMRLS